MHLFGKGSYVGPNNQLPLNSFLKKEVFPTSNTWDVIISYVKIASFLLGFSPTLIWPNPLYFI